MATESYVRTEMLPESAPPPSTVGVVGWMQQNLFSNWYNSVLTVISVAFILYVLALFLPWAISPTWSGTSLANCREILHEAGRDGHNAGACWGIIRERWLQILFGFYPGELYWRPILLLILLFVALAPVSCPSSCVS